MKYLKWIALVLVVAGGVAWWRWSRDKGAQPIDVRALVPDQTVQVRRGDIRRVVSATGSIIPNLDVTIKCKASGQIVSLPFDISDEVKQGDVLLKLDPVDEERNVRQAQVNLQVAENNLATSKLNLQIAQERLVNNRATANAAIESAEIDLKNKRTDLARNRALFAKKLVSQETLDNSELLFRQAEITLQNRKIALEELKTSETELKLKEHAIADATSTVETRKLNLSDAEQRLKDTIVYSPVSGVISALNVKAGDMVASSTTNTGGGTAIMTVSDISKMFSDVDVDESEIAGITPGLAAEIQTESVDDRKFHGVVRRIYPKGSRNRGVVNFKVRIEITENDRKYLRSEMTTNIDIILAESKNALLIPLQAVRLDQGGNGPGRMGPGGKAPGGMGPGGMGPGPKGPGGVGPGGMPPGGKGPGEKVPSGKKGPGEKGNDAKDKGNGKTAKSVIVQTGVDKHGKPVTEKRQVETGITNGEMVEIVSGLDENDTVVISVSPDESRWIRKALDKTVMTDWRSGRPARPARR